jgi:hypothetical protein
MAEGFASRTSYMIIWIERIAVGRREVTLRLECAGKDVYWYTREKERSEADGSELRAVKEHEEQLMAEV